MQENGPDRPDETRMHATQPTDLAGRIILEPAGGVFQRKAERNPTRIHAALRPRGLANIEVRVIELSTHGFRASTPANLEPNTEVRLRLPGLEPWPARVVWVTDAGYESLVGFEFERPLHPAVLATILQKAA